MSRYADRQELAEKIVWEGGLLEFIFGYGVSLTDLPEGDHELRQAFAAVLAVEPAIVQLESLLPEVD